jgi:hypothetical protein
LAVTKALERNPELLDLGVAPDQTWWARASAGDRTSHRGIVAVRNELGGTL